VRLNAIFSPDYLVKKIFPTTRHCSWMGTFFMKQNIL